jgi:hypothetical protein
VPSTDRRSTAQQDCGGNWFQIAAVLWTGKSSDFVRSAGLGSGSLEFLKSVIMKSAIAELLLMALLCFLALGFYRGWFGDSHDQPGSGASQHSTDRPNDRIDHRIKSHGSKVPANQSVDDRNARPT